MVGRVKDMNLNIGIEFFHPKEFEWKRPKKFYMSQQERQRRTTSNAKGIFQLWWGKGKLQLTWRRA